MKWPQLSIAKQMAVIVIVAINLAYLTIYRELALGTIMGGLAFQVGCVFLALKRGPARAFWAGFVYGVLIAMTSYYYAIAYPANLRTAPQTIQLHEFGSVLNAAWFNYFDLIGWTCQCLASYSKIFSYIYTYYYFVFMISLTSLPQLLAGLLLGLVGYGFALIGREDRRASEPEVQSPETDHP